MATAGNENHNAPVTGEGLIRAIGPWALGANPVNNTIGAGIFVLPALIASILGPEAVAAYLICGVAMALVLSCFIEIGTLVGRSGGPVAYVEEAFGPMAGFLAWALYAVTAVLVAQAALTNVLLDTASAAFPALAHGAPRVIGMALWVGVLAAVNICGVRHGMGVAVAATIGKLVPLLFIIVAGLMVMNWSNLRWTGWPAPSKLGEASLLLFFAYSGAEAVLAPSGEIRDPARTLPRAIFGATACFILIYVALQVVSQGILGQDLAHETRTPLAIAASRIVPFGRNLVLAGTFVSIAGTTAAGMVAVPRAFFLAAENRMLPAPLAAVHPRFRTPHWSIVTVAFLIFVLAASGSFRPLAVFSNAARLVMFATVCLGALCLRLTRKAVPGAFRAPGGLLIPVLGAAGVLWILHYSRWRQLAGLAAIAVAAAGYYMWRTRSLSRSRTGEQADSSH
jgi:APA family basic amino acid/polyamine antiporter